MNRVLRLARIPDVSAFVSAESLVVLDLVNDAIRSVLEERTWDFDIRADGVLQTIAMVTKTSGCNVTNNVQLATVSASDVPVSISYGAFVPKLVVTGDATFANTAFRVAHTNVVAGSQIITLDENWPGATAASAAYKFFVNEYLLPSTVRGVLQVLHQQTPIQLRMIEKSQRFDAMVPRPHDFASTYPWLCLIGSTGTGAVNDVTSQAAQTGTALFVFPTPSASYRLDYTYIYKHPTLALTTDTLDSVPDNVVDLVVQLAYARACQTTVVNDVQQGMVLEQNALRRIARAHEASRPDKLRHAPVRSMDDVSVGIRRDWGRLPPTTGSL